MIDEGRQMFDHLVIVGGVITGDAKDLEAQVKSQQLFDFTKN